MLRRTTQTVGESFSKRMIITKQKKNLRDPEYYKLGGGEESVHQINDLGGIYLITIPCLEMYFIPVCARNKNVEET